MRLAALLILMGVANCGSMIMIDRFAEVFVTVSVSVSSKATNDVLYNEGTNLVYLHRCCLNIGTPVQVFQQLHTNSLDF